MNDRSLQDKYDEAIGESHQMAMFLVAYLETLPSEARDWTDLGDQNHLRDGLRQLLASFVCGDKEPEDLSPRDVANALRDIAEDRRREFAHTRRLIDATAMSHR